MKQILNILCNWRVIALALLATPAVILTLGECDQVGSLIISKAAGISLTYTTVRLAKYWIAKGKLNGLAKLAEEE